MHIAFVIPDLKGGGAQKMIINLANEFAIQGHRVDLVLFSMEGIYKDLIAPNVRIVNFHKNRSLRALPSLVKYIKSQTPDIILSALFHVNLVTLMAKILAKETQAKFIISERNHLSLRLSEMSGFKRFFIKKFIQTLYPKADKIIGISNGVCEDLKNILKVKDKNFIQTIYNPVITPDFEEKIAQDVPDIFPKNAPLKLVASGRLVMQKDYPTLLRALQYYLQDYGAAHLVILGEGALKSDVITMANDMKIKDNISFLGFVDNPLAYMKQADIFVVSSIWEGFCNVIVEALYCGLKIVSTDCPSGPAEILKQGQYGALVRMGDYKEMAQALHRLSQEDISKESQKSRALDFSVGYKYQEFKNIFESM